MAYDDPDVGRVRSEVRRFKENVLVYVAVLAVLVLANIVAGGFWYAHFWLFWIALIWGVFIALQGARLFGDDIGRDWEDRMVNHVMARRRGEAPPRAAPRSDGGAPRPQPSPPPRPPTPDWPPSSAQPPAGTGPIITPPPLAPSQAIEGPRPASEPPPEPAA